MSSPPKAAPVAVAAAVELSRAGWVLPVVESIRDGMTCLSDAELSEVSTLMAQVCAAGEGARFALAAEADSRGVIASSTASGAAQWVQDRAGEAGVAVSSSVAGGFAKVIDAARLPGYALFKDAVSWRVGNRDRSGG